MLEMSIPLFLSSYLLLFHPHLRNSKTTDLIDEFDDELVGELSLEGDDPFGDKSRTFWTSWASLELLFAFDVIG